MRLGLAYPAAPPWRGTVGADALVPMRVKPGLGGPRVVHPMEKASCEHVVAVGVIRQRIVAPPSRRCRGGQSCSASAKSIARVVPPSLQCAERAHVAAVGRQAGCADPMGVCVSPSAWWLQAPSSARVVGASIVACPANRSRLRRRQPASGYPSRTRAATVVTTPRTTRASAKAGRDPRVATTLLVANLGHRGVVDRRALSPDRLAGPALPRLRELPVCSLPA